MMSATATGGWERARANPPVRLITHTPACRTYRRRQGWPSQSFRERSDTDTQRILMLVSSVALDGGAKSRIFSSFRGLVPDAMIVYVDVRGREWGSRRASVSCRL